MILTPHSCPKILARKPDILLNGKSILKLGVVFADEEGGVVRTYRKKPEDPIEYKDGARVTHEKKGKVVIKFTD